MWIFYGPGPHPALSHLPGYHHLICLSLASLVQLQHPRRFKDELAGCVNFSHHQIIWAEPFGKDYD